MIWFVIPIGALVVCIIEPAAALEAVGAIEAWTKRHSRPIILVVTFGVGAGLLIRGLLTL